MSEQATLIPPLPELRERLASNVQEGRLLRDLIRVAEKDAKLREMARRCRAAAPKPQACPA